MILIKKSSSSGVMVIVFRWSSSLELVQLANHFKRSNPTKVHSSSSEVNGSLSKIAQANDLKQSISS